MLGLIIICAPMTNGSTATPFPLSIVPIIFLSPDYSVWPHGPASLLMERKCTKVGKYPGGGLLRGS